MNKIQKIILFAYCVVIIGIVIYPPYNLTVQGFLIRSEYSFLWEPIMHGSEYGNTLVGVIDTPKILIQMLAATLVAVALTFIFRSKEI